MIFKSLTALGFTVDADSHSILLAIASQLRHFAYYFEYDRYIKWQESFTQKNRYARKARIRASTINREVYILYIGCLARSDSVYILCSLAWKTSGTSWRFVTSNGDSFEWYKTVCSILEYDICRFMYIHMYVCVSFPRYSVMCIDCTVAGKSVYICIYIYTCVCI